jgi:hypothetical protein
LKVLVEERRHLYVVVFVGGIFLRTIKYYFGTLFSPFYKSEF